MHIPKITLDNFGPIEHTEVLFTAQNINKTAGQLTFRYA